MANLAVREITKVNDYERKWKIKTNNSKFTIIPMAVKMKEDIIINNNIIPYKSCGKNAGSKNCQYWTVITRRRNYNKGKYCTPRTTKIQKFIHKNKITFN